MLFETVNNNVQIIVSLPMNKVRIHLCLLYNSAGAAIYLHPVKNGDTAVKYSVGRDLTKGCS